MYLPPSTKCATETETDPDCRRFAMHGLSKLPHGMGESFIDRMHLAPSFENEQST